METQEEEGGGEGEGARSSVACLSHLAIDSTSLSRRSTAPTANTDTSSMWALSSFIPSNTHKNTIYFLFLSPSRLFVCGRHLSPGIAIVFLATIYMYQNLSVIHLSVLLASSANAPRSSL